MAAHPLTLPEPAPPRPTGARAMTRCECAGVSFDEIASRVRLGADAPEALRRTGCGQTCTACLPDLARFLESL
jgi:bacterioferritin-associated ferredoxin